MKKVNGQPIPEGLSLDELETMMRSSDMHTFAVACEALRLTNTPQAYELLKRHISESDAYKRRYVLSVIFDYPEAAELVPHLEQALRSKKSFLVGTALNLIIEEKARVSDEVLLACFERNLKKLSNYDCYALTTVENTQANIRRILNMYHSCKDDSLRTGLAECLYGFCTGETYPAFYQLFQDDPVPHIRILACRLARDHQRPDLLQKFRQDKDGHIRKLALSV